MKERPIIFSTEMVKAILDGRKTQTRRVVKPQPKTIDLEGKPIVCWQGKNTLDFIDEIHCGGYGDFRSRLSLRCPYGQVGDRLWVRETWATEKRLDNLSIAELGHASEMPIFYKADNSRTLLEIGNWRNSIFMPRWASRITLKITGIRVERLQEITDRDCEKEGLDNPCGYYCDEAIGHVDHQGTINNFTKLWDSINARRGYSWESNPWVWVISFKRVQ